MSIEVHYSVSTHGLGDRSRVSTRDCVRSRSVGLKKFLDTPSMLEFQENQNPNEKPIMWTDYHRINSTHFRSDSLDSDIGILPDDPIVLSDLRNMRHITCLIVADIDVGDKVTQPVFVNKI